jgi:hypothetical protein
VLFVEFSASRIVERSDNTASTIVLRDASGNFAAGTITAGAVTSTGLVTVASLKGTGATTVTNILDEDNMASNSATALATQQSIKAYVDAQVATVDTLAEVLANGNTTGATNIIVSSGQKITTNTIDETTAAAGVTIDSVLLKDDVVNATDIEVNTISANNGTLAVTLGSTGVATIAQQPIVSSLTASQAVFTDGSKGLVSNAITGTGSVVMSDAPTLTGTTTAATLNATTLGGTLSTAAQTNVTSLGTLTALTLAGPFTQPLRTETGNYTLTTTDERLLSNPSSGTATITLPTAVGLSGRSYFIKRVSTVPGARVVVATTSSQTIDGTLTRELFAADAWMRVVSNGTNWVVEDYEDKVPSELAFLEYAVGDSLASATFARSGTASFVDRNGIVKSAADGVVRDAAYVLATGATTPTRALLLEPQATNLFERSEEINNAYWSKLASSVSADATVAPDGTTTADKIVEDAANAAHSVRRSISFTSGTTYTLSVFAKAAERTTCRLRMASAGFAAEGGVSVNLATGTLSSTSANFTSRIVALANGWYRVSLTGTANATAAGLVQFQLQTANYAGDGTSGLFYWGAQIEEGPVATSYIKTVSGTASRTADALTFPYTAPPQALTVYARGVEQGAVLSGTDTRLLAITADPLADAALRVDVNASAVYGVRSNQVAGDVESNTSAAPVVTNTVELRGTLETTGEVQIHQSIGGAAETSGTLSGANALDAAWSGQLLHLGGIGTSNRGAFAFTNVVIAQGVQTMHTMRQLAEIV